MSANVKEGICFGCHKWAEERFTLRLDTYKGSSHYRYIESLPQEYMYECVCKDCANQIMTDFWESVLHGTE